MAKTHAEEQAAHADVLVDGMTAQARHGVLGTHNVRMDVQIEHRQPGVHYAQSQGEKVNAMFQKLHHGRDGVWEVVAETDVACVAIEIQTAEHGCEEQRCLAEKMTLCLHGLRALVEANDDVGWVDAREQSLLRVSLGLSECGRESMLTASGSLIRL